MYLVEIESCPACLSKEVDKNYLISTEGYMSEKGCRHDRCKSCGTLFLNPRPTEEGLNSFYKANATETSIEETVKNSAMRVLEKNKADYFYQNRVEPIFKSIGKENLKVFDVGSGVGAFIYMANRHGMKVRGCDISAVSVKAGREALNLSKEEIFEGGIYDIPEEKFELITLWTVIEHLLEPEEYINFLKNKLDSTCGYILLEFPTVDSMLFEKTKGSFFWVMPPYHINLFSVEGITSMLTRCGFEVIYQHQMPNNWYYTDSLADSLNVKEKFEKVRKEIPQLFSEIDRTFDEMSQKLDKSSTRWILAKLY